MAAALGFRWDGKKTRLLARTIPDSFNTESLMAFLKDLKRFVQGVPVILVWDHLPAHRSKLMKCFLWEQRDWLEIEWLPGYSPDLNPTEGVWNNIKSRELANFGSVANLKFRMREAIRPRDHARGESPKSPATNATCPAMSSFGNHLTCPLRIIFTVAIP